MKFFFFFLNLSLCIFLASCSSDSAEKPTPTHLSLTSFSLVTHPQLNERRPLTVDLVVCYDFDLLKKLKTMTANEYFSSIDVLKRDNLNLFCIFRWEPVPNQILEDYHPIVPKKKEVMGAFLFIDFKSEGTHRLEIPPKSKAIRLTLGSDQIESFDTDVQSKFVSSSSLAVYPTDTNLIFQPRSS